MLSARFRSRMRQALQALAPELLARVPGKTWRKGWVVHSQPAGSGEKALQYLSRYVFKTAISSARLLWQDDDRVAFSWRDSASREERTCVLPADEFLRRFLQHVLPRRFRRVRTYGWLSPAAKLRRSQVHALLGTHSSSRSDPGKAICSSPSRRHRPVQFLCPHCSRPMNRIGELGRAPPRTSCLSS